MNVNQLGFLILHEQRSYFFICFPLFSSSSPVFLVEFMFHGITAVSYFTGTSSLLSGEEIMILYETM